MNSKTKTIINLLLFIALLAGGVCLFLGCGADQSPPAKSEQLYTCGMHPTVIVNKPGLCPICNMKLTPIRKQPGTNSNSTNAAATAGSRKIKFYKSTMHPGEISQTPAKDSMGMDMAPVFEDEAAAAESSVISIDPVTIQNMGIRSGIVTRGPLRRVIRTVGMVDYDETALADVTTKFRGWIEKLYVDATGKLMHRGEPLFEIYSPELYLAQTEFLLTQNSLTNPNSAVEGLRASAMTKLKFWDISDEQVAELERTRQPKKTLQVTAPRDGIVVEKMVFEGQMVEAGAKLYRLADLATVWVQAQVYEQDLAYIQLGQEAVVSIAYLPDRKFRGRVTYLYPMVDDKTRTARVRMEFHNPGYFLKPGMYATVELHSEVDTSALLVPDSAVLRSGEKNTVFVALDGGRFEPRTVAIGLRSENDLYQVLSGLSEGERVVTSGQFMLDSESQLREAIQKMLSPAKAESSSEQSPRQAKPTNQEPITLTPPAGAKELVYLCPMPEHLSVQYEHPGKCPLCGMALVPVTHELLAKIQPGARIDYYTCPMPEHANVRTNKPGKCPRCSMTLIPVTEAKLMSAPTAVASPLYTCPMAEDADVVSDKPSTCPKCEMKLVETSKVKHGKIAEENWRKTHPVPAANTAREAK